MDPLSVTASIIAVLQLTYEITQYLSDAIDAPKECKQCIVEASNLIGPLTSLRYRAEQADIHDPWFEQLRRLNVKDGPIEQYEQALRLLQQRTEIKDGMQRIRKRLTWTFRKEEVVRILSKMERLKTLVSVALEMDHFKLSQAIKEDIAILQESLNPLQKTIDAIGTLQLEIHSDTSSIKDTQSAQQHQNLLNWLSPTDFPARQHEEICRKQEGTAQWFLDSLEFKRWVEGTDKTLFCPGIPGAGKTMMTAVVIDHLRRTTLSRETGIAYVFCSYKAQFNQTAPDLFAALLKQLIQIRLDLTVPVKEIYDQCQGGKASSDQIYKAITSACSAYKTVYLLLDALDEYIDTNTNLTRFIDEILQLQKSADVRILLTSRFLPSITERFTSVPTLEVRASEEDVRRFVDNQLPSLPKCVREDQDLQTMIVNTVTKAAQGMFLLARLHVESLHHKRNRSKVLATLDKISCQSGNSGSAKSLDEAYSKAYDEAIERIDNQPLDDRSLAKSALSWVSLAQRFLTTKELSCALAIEPGDKSLNRDNICDIEDIISVCAGLITVDESSGIVRFVHYTTQEYFERVLSTWNPKAQNDIAVACLTYLSFDTFQSLIHFTYKDIKRRLAENEFFEYSAQYWPQHVRPMQTTCISNVALNFLRNPALVNSVHQLEASKSNLAYFLDELQIKLRERSPKLHSGISGLHLVARHGLQDLAGLLMEDRGIRLTVDSEDSFGKTPLRYAIEGGHEAIVKTLLETVKVNVKLRNSVKTQTALDWAVNSGHAGVVRLLLETGMFNDSLMGLWGGRTKLGRAACRGYVEVVQVLLEVCEADVDRRDCDGRTPLWWAVYRGNKSIVLLLLKTGKVEVNSKDIDDITPLSLAVKYGRIEIVQLLLETEKVEVNSKDRNGETPLFKAVLHGNEAIVQLLLKKSKVGFDLKKFYGEMLLHQAVESGHKAIVQLLLETGKIEVDSKDIFGITPLALAAAYGHEAMVRLLLETGKVDIDSKNIWGETPLSSAVKYGYRAIVRLLLETGKVEVDSRDKKGRTPLSEAARQGHEAIVQLLLDTGKVEVESKNVWGETPLSEAAYYGHEAIVRLLLETGQVDIESKDDEGKTPLSRAMDKGHEGVVRLLQRSGAVASQHAVAQSVAAESAQSM